jgi:hypothetical protein
MVLDPSFRKSALKMIVRFAISVVEQMLTSYHIGYFERKIKSAMKTFLSGRTKRQLDTGDIVKVVVVSKQRSKWGENYMLSNGIMRHSRVGQTCRG